MLLSWFIFSPPNRPCINRQQCAQALLAAEGITDVSCLKLGRLFRRDMLDVIQTGTIDEALYKLFLGILENWGLDNQEVEGVNSVLKYASGLSPNISFKLLSSRITIKKLLHTCSDKSMRGVLLQDCEFFYDPGQRGDPRSCYGSPRFSQVFRYRPLFRYRPQCTHRSFQERCVHWGGWVVSALALARTGETHRTLMVLVIKPE